MAFRKLSLERTSNNLACALQCFLCLFCARFALLKTLLSNQNLTKKDLKIESFFWNPLPKSQNLTPHPCPPPLKNFSLDTLNSEQKPSVKKPVDRRWFWNLPVGWGRENPDRFYLCAVLRHWLRPVFFCSFVLIESIWCLLTVPMAGFAGLMSLHYGYGTHTLNFSTYSICIYHLVVLIVFSPRPCWRLFSDCSLDLASRCFTTVK